MAFWYWFAAVVATHVLTIMFMFAIQAPSAAELTEKCALNGGVRQVSDAGYFTRLGPLVVCEDGTVRKAKN